MTTSTKLRWPDVLTEDHPTGAEAFLLPDEALHDVSV
jgi:hypothetical protein